MGRFVVGDVHSCYDKFVKALEYAGFNDETDILYSVGDLFDRGSDTDKMVDFVMSEQAKMLFRPVFGNHDLWAYQYLCPEHFNYEIEWINENGGYNTVLSIYGVSKERRNKLRDILGNLPYRIELDDFIIQHAPTRGLNDYKDLTLKNCLERNVCSRAYDRQFWDRTVLRSSKEIFPLTNKPLDWHYTPTKKTLITGHTVMLEGPVYDKSLNLINLDTGSFINGVGEVCVMNLDTMEWFKSNGDKGKFDKKSEN